MKGIIKKIILYLFLLSVSAAWSQNEFAETYSAPEKKEFNQEEYQKLKKEVDLIEEMEQKRLLEDSSQFGTGYGVEKGENYIVYDYDSITGKGSYSEKHRGAGAQNLNDGVQPNARDQENRKEFKRRQSNERLKNRIRKVKENRLRRKKEEDWRSKPRSENPNNPSENNISDGGFLKLLLILVIAFILGAAAYMLFVKSPFEGADTKILYHQEMNPDSVNLSELEIKIKRAKELNDFRAATRLYFVWVIKELSDKGYIQWKKRKTNYHYHIELEGKSFSDDFGIGVKNYEFIWYGKYEILWEEFKLVENQFIKLIDKIKR